MHDLKDLTARYVAAFDRRDLDALGALMRDDFTLEDPAGRFEGRSTVLDYVNGIFKTVSHLEFRARNLFADADGVVTIIEFQLLLDGKTLIGTDVIEWSGDRMANLRAYLHETPGPV